MSAIHADSKVIAKQGMVSSTLDGEQVILDAQQGKYFGLNAVGAFIWERIQEPTEVNAIFDAVLAEYDIQRERVEADVLALLNDLSGKGLVHIHDESPA